mmetsp:Transcript_119482/g.217136  ORF Transcript_119482/g.217136 Transcript_119482/m.217136 type:complete len:294 (+) Transcript_119482:1-882(+)
MEDWHLGSLDAFAPKEWLERPQRTTGAIASLEKFVSRADLVMKRGSHTQKHFLMVAQESRQDAQFMNIKESEGRIEFADAAFAMLREVGKVIPLKLLLGLNAEDARKELVPALTPAFCHITNCILPMHYRIGDRPEWIQIDPLTGEILFLSQPPNFTDDVTSVPLFIKLAYYELQRHDKAAKMFDMDLEVDVRGEMDMSAYLKAKVGTLLKELKKVKGKFCQKLEERLSPIYNFYQGEYVDDVSFVQFVCSVSEAAHLARTSVRSHTVCDDSLLNHKFSEIRTKFAAPSKPPK